jgi:hypothetical protein
VSEIPAVANESEIPAVANESEIPAVSKVSEIPAVSKVSEVHTPSMAAMLHTDIRTDSPPKRLLDIPKTGPKIGPKAGPVDKISLAYEKIVNLICEAIKNANELMENQSIYHVNILGIITNDLDGRDLKFNPSNFTNSDATEVHWKKFSKKPPILDTKINRQMLENSNILVVYDQHDRKIIRSVLYGYGLEEKDNSFLIFE